MTTEKPFPFDACESASKCRPDMEAMIPAGADWVEIHCGKCKAQGILRRASDAAPAAPAKAAPAPAAAPAAATPPASGSAA